MRARRLKTRVSGAVILAAATAVAACGGSVTRFEPSGSGGQAGSGGATGGSAGRGGAGGTGGVSGSGGAGGVPACSTQPAKPGTRCSPAGLVCRFPRCSNLQNIVEEDCENGTWQAVLGSSCFPTCPAAEPKDGDPCPFADGVSCSYGQCCPDEATCEGGKWQVVLSGCTQPAEVCPETLPQDGAPCGGPCVMPASACAYNSARQLDFSDTTCGGSPAFTANCMNGTWTIGTCAFAGDGAGGSG